MRKIAIFTFLMLSFSRISKAQDTHYWTQQFGTKSALLGGAVIGGVRDNSGIYYNPATIAYINNKNLSVTANAYQWDNIKFKNGAGANVDLKSSTLQTMPLIISGLFIPKKEKWQRHHFGYCLITRDQFNLKTSARVDDFRNLIEDSLSPGNEDYIGQVTIKSSIYEMLTGWAYSFKINEKFSIGLGNYGSYRSWHSDWYRVTRIVPTDSTGSFQGISTFNRTTSIEIKDVYSVFKLGFAVNLEKLKLGLTVTSPSFNVWGTGTIMADVTAANVDYQNNGNFVSFTANDRQEGLKPTYKTPLIIGFGAEYKFKTTLLAFSCEWFDKVKNYNILTPKSAIYLRPANYNLSSSDSILSISDEKKSVFNYAIGIEQKLNDKMSMSVGFRTNRSFSKVNQLKTVNLTFTNWDIYHFTFGITRKREKSDLSLAINYAHGSKRDQYQWVNLQNVSSDNYYAGTPEVSHLTYNSFSVVLGFTHYLK